MIREKNHKNTWQATVLTLFPNMFPSVLGQSLAGNALKTGFWSLKTLDIRGFAGDKHRSVDSPPFGGGAGMVLRADIVDAALASIENVPGRRIYFSPRGRCFDQSIAEDLVSDPGVVLVCGRFEGLDQRLIDARGLEEISLGDFVLSGGEIASIALLDTCVRLLPGVLGSKEGLKEESFTNGLLEYPHYTQPREWNGRTVPEVLLSGHHENIKSWRREEAEMITRDRRPDLWERYKKLR